ncbi:MAG: hypothetical protein ACKO5K_04240 [Armatimonadota bacterium]
MPDTNDPPAKSSIAGLKFNSTGRDDTSTDILVPEVDARSKSRRTAMIVGIVVMVVAVMIVSFARNPIKWESLLEQGPDKSFGPSGERKVD